MIVQLTQYGYKDDPYGDTLTREGWGSFGNKIGGASCALKRSTAKKIGATPKCKVELWHNGSLLMTRFWDDVVPEFDKGNRCDLYEPTGMVSGLPDEVEVRVVPDAGSTPAQPAG